MTFSIYQIIGIIDGQSETPLAIDITEGMDVTLQCRFQAELSKKPFHLYWIRTNRYGTDIVAIGETLLDQTNYK